MVDEIQLVFSCVSMCTHTPPYRRDWEMCVVTLLLSRVLQKVQNSPQGWRKAPAVVNRCGVHESCHWKCTCYKEETRGFFALWEANPFHLRAITFTHTLNKWGGWEGEGSWDQKLAGYAFPETGCVWDWAYDIRVVKTRHLVMWSQTQRNMALETVAAGSSPSILVNNCGKEQSELLFHGQPL